MRRYQKMPTLNLKKMINEIGHNLDTKSTELLKDNEDLLKKVSVEGFKDLLISAKLKKKERVDAYVYSSLLRSLSDEDFLKLRRETVESINLMADMEKRKHKLVTDLLEIGETVIIDHAIKYAALAALV